MTHRTCLVCAALFAARAAGKPQRYCSKRCGQLAVNARRRTLTIQAGTQFRCEYCDIAVPYNGVGRPPRFCSTACKQRRYYTDDPSVKKKHNLQFSERHPGCHASWQQEYRDSDPERTRNACRRYYAKNAHNWDKYRSPRSLYIRPEDAAYTTWLKVAARFAMWGGKCWICGDVATLGIM